MSYPNERDCEHGLLRGSCDRCDDAEEIARLRQQVNVLEITLASTAENSHYWHGEAMLLQQRLAAQPVAVEQSNQRLLTALKDVTSALVISPSCQRRTVDVCGCLTCAKHRAERAIAAYTAPPAQARPIDAIQARQDGYMAGFVRAGFECRNADVTALCGEPQYLKWMADDLSEPQTGVEPLLWRAGYEAGKAAARPVVPEGYALVKTSDLKFIAEMQEDDWPGQGAGAAELSRHWFQSFQRKKERAKSMLLTAAPAAQEQEGLE